MSLAIAVIRKATTSRIIPNQKTCYSLDNFYVNDCYFRSFIIYTLYLIFDLVLGGSA